MKQEIKKLRKEFDRDCRQRDGNKCLTCGRSDVKMSVHHITDRHDLPNGGYAMSNGITRCPGRGGIQMTCMRRLDQAKKRHEKIRRN